MKSSTYPYRYQLKVFDEHGHEVGEYHGYNNLSLKTANVLMGNFRLFKVVMLILGFLVGTMTSGYTSSFLDSLLQG